jgi:hypothetical protein
MRIGYQVRYRLLKVSTIEFDLNLLGIIDTNLHLEAVLWILEKNKLITLSENPFFYGNLPELYGSDFCKDPLGFGKELRNIFQDNGSDPVLNVLTDRAHHVYVKLDDGYRVFGNGWKPDGHLILKGWVYLMLVSVY